jgi:MFS family permease
VSGISAVRPEAHEECFLQLMEFLALNQNAVEFALGRQRRSPVRIRDLRAGFLVRPFGAIIFGRVGDLVGRKYTFLVTIMVMGTSTFLAGLLPTFSSIGWGAPILLVTLRLLQGLAVGGEYGGAATYVAEHARANERGYATSWVQSTATLGLALALVIIMICREFMDTRSFAEWLLAHSLHRVCHFAGVLGLHSAAARRIPRLPAHEGRGQGVAGTAHREFLALSEQ